MADWDFRPARKDRETLRIAAHRVFDRMVASDDRFLATVNDMENRLRDVVRFAMVLVVSAPMFALVYGVRLLAERAGYEIEALSHLGWNLLATVVLAFFTVYILLGRWFKKVSAGFLDFCGRVFVGQRKLHRTPQHRQQMLNAVINWLRTRPLYSGMQFRRLHDGRAPAEVLSEGFVATVRQLQAPQASAGFLVLRGLTETKPKAMYLRHWFRSPLAEGRKPRLARGGFFYRLLRHRPFNYFIQARGLRNALSISFLFDILGAELRDEIPGAIRWRREYVTNRDRQATALFDTGDLHTRFRTNSPHYRWPDADNSDSIGETAMWRAILCNENPCAMPVFVIRVRDVVARFEEVIADFYDDCRGNSDKALDARADRLETTITKLMKTNVRMFGKFQHKSLQTTSEIGLEPAPLLRDLNLTEEENEDPHNVFADGHFRDWGLRWDPNQVDWHQLTADADSETSQAFAVLIEAIDRQRTVAEPVVLRRGDCLLVDNLRCMVARKEAPPRSVIRAGLAMPPEWWLAGIYGFRRGFKSAREPFEENYRQLSPVEPGTERAAMPEGDGSAGADPAPILEYMSRQRAGD